MAHDGRVRVPSVLDRPALMRLISQLRTKRWFPFKSDSIVDASLIDAIPEVISPGESAIVIADIRTTSGGSIMVITPSLRAPSFSGNTALYSDAVEDGSISTLISRFSSGNSIDGSSGRITLQGPYAEEFQAYMKTHQQVVPLNVEQSNSSFTIGSQYICKVFRRPISPDNPDFTIPVKLYTETGFRNIPRPIAQIVHEPDPLLSVASIQENVKNSGDYWHYFLQLSRNMAEKLNHGSSAAEEYISDMGASAAELAETVSEMHRALYGIRGPGFAHEKFTAEDISSMKLRYMDLASAIRRTPISLSINGRLYDGVDFYEMIKSFVDNFDFSPMRTIEKIRYHGDLHLVQILKTKRGPVIIDFEGEPLRGESERSSPGCVLKDVAGMTRSIDYALSFYSRTDEKLSRKTEKISMEMRNIFLEAYFNKSSDLPTIPEHMDDFIKATAYYEVEKAVYEANYEMNNRPDWIIIPARALVKTLSNKSSSERFRRMK